MILFLVLVPFSSWFLEEILPLLHMIPFSGLFGGFCDLKAWLAHRQIRNSQDRVVLAVSLSYRNLGDKNAIGIAKPETSEVWEYLFIVPLATRFCFRV